MQVFPTWRYHRSEEPKLVKSEAELQALGPAWADTPAAFEKPESYPEHMEQWESKDEKKQKRTKKKVE